MMILTLFLTVAMLVAEVAGHGYLMEPPARNTMWRAGFESEPNYNDNELNCGGAGNQWGNYDGKCGVCGDPYQGPREHEAGGKFADVNRDITRCYNTVDDVIDIHVRITSHHKGYFEFRLCKHNSMGTRVQQSCFDDGILLTVRDTGDTRYDINYNKQENYYFRLDMPRNVTCSQCVLQWKYNTGNSWGCDDTGCGTGLGAQEQFINCADIAILRDCAVGPMTSTLSTVSQCQDDKFYPDCSRVLHGSSIAFRIDLEGPSTKRSTTLKTTPSVTSTTDETTSSTTATPSTSAKTSSSTATPSTSAETSSTTTTEETTPSSAPTSSSTSSTTQAATSTTTEETTLSSTPTSSTTSSTTQAATSSSTTESTIGSTIVQTTSASPTNEPALECYAVEEQKRQPGLDQWCSENCLNAATPNCPEDFCECSEKGDTTAEPPASTTEAEVRCWGIGEWNTPYEMQAWCTNNCLHYPRNCPEALCKCSDD